MLLCLYVNHCDNKCNLSNLKAYKIGGLFGVSDQMNIISGKDEKKNRNTKKDKRKNEKKKMENDNENERCREKY